MTVPVLPMTERVLLILALAVGIAGFVLARQYLARADNALAARYAQRYTPARVLVAAQDLHPGVRLEEPQLAVRAMPRRFLPSASVPAEDLGSVIRATLRVPLKAGDPIERSALISGASSLATRLPKGWRGLSLTALSLGPVGSELRTGDRIDLWLGGDSQGGTPNERARLLENIAVITTGDDIVAQPGSDIPNDDGSVTLQVTPPQALQILEGLRSGGIAAMLRAPDEPAPPALAPLSAHVGVTRRFGTRARNAVELLAADGQTLVRRWLLVRDQP